MNDFVGIGYGLLALKPDELETVFAGTKSDPHGVKAVIGAGTGLGECFLTYNGKEYDVYPAEGGHTDFAPRNQTEFEILQYCLANIKGDDGKPIDRVSVERVTSGTGMKNIYNYLAEKKPGKADQQIAERIRSGNRKLRG
jgi:glucokinase